MERQRDGERTKRDSRIKKKKEGKETCSEGESRMPRIQRRKRLTRKNGGERADHES